MSKYSLRDSLLNMLGEFVAINKTPDFKLSTQSNQYLDEAIRDEIEHKKKISTNSLFFSRSQQHLRHMRTTSTNSGYQGSTAAKVNSNLLPEDESYAVRCRRQSLPVSVTPSDKRFFFQRLRRPSSRRQNSYEVTEEENDQHPSQQKGFHDSQQKRRHNSVISESEESYKTDEENKNISSATTITEKQVNKNETSFGNQPYRYSTNLKIR